MNCRTEQEFGKQNLHQTEASSKYSDKTGEISSASTSTYILSYIFVQTRDFDKDTNMLAGISDSLLKIPLLNLNDNIV